MNILYILSATLEYGGATKSFVAMLKGLVRYGVTPIVVVPDCNGVCRTFNEMGIEYIVLPYRPNSYPPFRSIMDALLFLPRLIGRAALNYLAVRKLCAQIVAKRIDIIHTNVSIINIGMNVASRLGIPHVYHFREYADLDFGYYYMPMKSFFHKKVRENGNYVVSITKAINQHHGFIDYNRSYVIYNGICSKKSIIKREKVEDFFLYAGRLEPAKGLDELLLAYADYYKNCIRKIPLYIAGDSNKSEYKKRINNMIEELGISDSIVQLGYVDDIGSYMRRAKATIVPSRSEAFGRCLPEAMFCQCLTIGKNTAGTKEQFDNGLSLTGDEIGLRYNSQTELTGCLLHVAEHYSDFASPMVERAFKTVCSLYSEESNVENINKLYNDILRDNKYKIICNNLYNN